MHTVFLPKKKRSAIRPAAFGLCMSAIADFRGEAWSLRQVTPVCSAFMVVWQLVFKEDYVEPLEMWHSLLTNTVIIAKEKKKNRSRSSHSRGDCVTSLSFGENCSILTRRTAEKFAMLVVVSYVRSLVLLSMTGEWSHVH